MDPQASAGARPSRLRRWVALLAVPVLALTSLVVAWAWSPTAQAAPEIPVPYRIGYASGDVPALSAVLPTADGSTDLPAPEATRPAEEPSVHGGALVFVTHRSGHRDGDLRYRAPGARLPVPVLDDDFDDRSPQLSPDGRTIAFESDRGGQPDIWTIGVDGAGLRRVTDHPGDDRRPTWSPAGDRIAFSSTRDDPAADIYTVAAAGGPVTRLIADPAADTEPAFAPTGAIAFTTTRFTPAGATTTVRSVAVLAGPGGAVQQVVTGEQAAWSADGQRLAFVTRATDPAGDVGVVTVPTGATMLVARRPARAETHPTFSGQMVVYQDVSAGGGTDVWSADPAGQDRRDHTQRPGAGETAPAYTVDGTRLAYSEEAVPAGVESPPMSRIVVADADGSNPRPVSKLTPGQVDDHPAWSPDGALIAYSRRGADESRSVVIAQAEDGTEVGRIPVPRALSAADAQPSWSPDGRRIVFERRATRRPTGKVIPGATDRRLNPGGSFTIDQRVLTPAIPPTPDIVLLVDTTGSMSGAIANVKANVRAMIDEVRKVQPNAQFAVAGFKDVVDEDGIFTLYQKITPDVDAIQQAVSKLSAQGGGDVPEDWGYALARISGDATGFRAGSSRVVVLIGDAPTHDPSNGVSLDQSIAALQRIQARVVAVDLGSLDSPSGCEVVCERQASRVVEATGGQIVTGVAGDQVSDAVLNGLRGLAVTVTPIIGRCDAGLTVTFTPPTPTTVRDGADVHYRQTVTIGPNAVPGTVLHCDVSYPISPNPQYPDGRDPAYDAPVTVRVNNPAQPLVTVDDVTVTSSDPSGAAVPYPATAVAADGVALVPTCTPSSGAQFPIGQTTVTCTAVDLSGVSGRDTALITVVDPGIDGQDRIWVSTLAADVDGPVIPIAVLDQVDVSVQARRTCSAGVLDAGPAFAPDGTALAFAASGALCITDPVGHQGRLLTTSDDPRVEDPAWSPDSTLLAYTSVTRAESPGRSLRTIARTGGTPTVLIDTPGEALQPAFRPLVSGLGLTVTATPRQTVAGSPPITLTYTVTNLTTSPAARVWLGSVAPSRSPAAVEIGTLPPGGSSTVTVEVDTATPLAGTVTGTVTGLFPGDVPASAIITTYIVVDPRPVRPTLPTTSPPTVPRARYTPVLTTESQVGPPGFVTMAVGRGFPPNTLVTLKWEPGQEALTRIRTGADGTFRTQMLIFRKDQIGQRTLIATGRGFTQAQAPFLVVPNGQQPPDWVVRR